MEDYLASGDAFAATERLFAALDRAFGLLDQRTRLRAYTETLAISEGRLKMLHHMGELLGIYQGALRDRTPMPEVLALLPPLAVVQKLLAEAINRAERPVGAAPDERGPLPHGDVTARGKSMTEAGGAERLRECFSWQPPTPWSCPRCGTETLTAELAPRCETCGFREGT